MTDKYEKEFPLSGPLTFPGRIDKKLAEVFDRTTGNKPGSISSDGKTIKDYINLMTDEDLLAFANKIITSGRALSIITSPMLTTAEVTAFVNNMTNQLLSSTQFRNTVSALIKNYMDSHNSGSGTGTNNTQQPADNGSGAVSK